ncbi:MAG TPA: hypothetical protein VFA48_08550 [Gammaproteobacteria bacterium]|nr:hypothetical protein [Gammaproteobacteria bacterium]
MVVAWALPALVALLLSVPVYAACEVTTYTPATSHRVEVEPVMGAPGPREGCCSGLSAPNSVVAAQSMRQFRVRPPLAITGSFALFPPLHMTPLPSGQMITHVFSSRNVYALTQRLRL